MNTKRSLIFLAAMLMLMLAIGCSDDDNPTGGDGIPSDYITSTWDATNQVWVSTVDGSSYDEFRYFSFAAEDTLSEPAKQAATWDIAFRREVIKTNGGSSATNGGDIEGASLGQVDFAGVTIDDTTGADWTSDAIDYFISDWFTYNFQTHQLDLTHYVYSMVDAEGDNYVKFRVDSLVGNGMGSMGTVWISYYYQPTANSRILSGTVQTASITVGTGTGYFDFSSGSAVTPANPANSNAWDIAFNNYDLMQNSGPNGTGECAAFFAWGELTDPTDIAAFTEQPAMAPLFPDIPSSVMTDWYNYNGQTHQLSSKSNVYLIKTGDKVYKLRIEGYYKNVGGVPTSGNYSFVWKEL